MFGGGAATGTGTPPKSTVLTQLRFVPLMVTGVPPVLRPLFGLIDIGIGAEPVVTVTLAVAVPPPND